MYLTEEDGLMTPYNLRSSRKNSLEGGASQCSTENQYNFKRYDSHGFVFC